MKYFLARLSGDPVQRVKALIEAAVLRGAVKE
jgi:hypothetical protein